MLSTHTQNQLSATTKILFKKITNITEQLPIFNEAYHQRLLLIGLPLEEQLSILKRWFEKHHDRCLHQLKTLAKKHTRHDDIAVFTKIFIEQLSQLLLSMTDELFINPLKENILRFCKKNLYNGCYVRIMHYELCAHALISEFSPDKKALLKLSSSAWNQNTKYASSKRSYRDYLSDFIQHAFIFIVFLQIVIAMCLDYNDTKNTAAFQKKAFQRLPVDMLLICSLMLIKSPLWHLITGRPIMPTTRGNNDLLMEGISQTVLLYLENSQKQPAASRVYESLFAVLPPPKKKKKDEPQEDNSTGFIAKQLKRWQLPSENKTIAPALTEKKSDDNYHDLHLENGMSYYQLSNTKYVKFNPDKVAEMHHDQRSEQKDRLAQSFLDHITEKRQLDALATTEKNRKNYPLYNMNAKIRITDSGTPYRLAFKIRPPEQNEAEELGIQTEVYSPKKMVQHGRGGY